MANSNIFKGVNSIKFNQRFKEDKDCIEYLSQIKWADGFVCKQCQNDKFCKGKNTYNRLRDTKGIEIHPNHGVLIGYFNQHGELTRPYCEITKSGLTINLEPQKE